MLYNFLSTFFNSRRTSDTLSVLGFIGDFVLASFGLFASAGITHILPIIFAPSIRPSLHKICILLLLIFHLLENSCTGK